MRKLMLVLVGVCLSISAMAVTVTITNKLNTADLMPFVIGSGFPRHAYPEIKHGSKPSSLSVPVSKFVVNLRSTDGATCTLLRVPGAGLSCQQCSYKYKCATDGDSAVISRSLLS